MLSALSGNPCQKMNNVLFLWRLDSISLKHQLGFMDDCSRHLWLFFQNFAKMHYCMKLNFSWTVSKLVYNNRGDYFFNLTLFYQKLRENIYRKFSEIFKIVFCKFRQNVSDKILVKFFYAMITVRLHYFKICKIILIFFQYQWIFLERMQFVAFL